MKHSKMFQISVLNKNDFLTQLCWERHQIGTFTTKISKPKLFFNFILYQTTLVHIWLKTPKICKIGLGEIFLVLNYLHPIPLCSLTALSPITEFRPTPFCPQSHFDFDQCVIFHSNFNSFLLFHSNTFSNIVATFW